MTSDSQINSRLYAFIDGRFKALQDGETADNGGIAINGYMGWGNGAQETITTLRTYQYELQSVAVASLVGKADLMLTIGTMPSAYEPYTGETKEISFPQEAGTVYGGELTIYENGTGKLVVTHKDIMIDPDSIAQNDVNSKNFYIMAEDAPVLPSNYDTKVYVKSDTLKPVSPSGVGEDSIYTVALRDSKRIVFNVNTDNIADVKAWFTANPTKVIYPLAEPITYDLSASEVNAVLTSLKGTNNIWADTGDILYVKYHD